MVNLPQVECPVRHYFAGGLYAREITIPKGTALIGAVHKMDNIVILSSGVLRLVTEDGTKEISAPTTLICKAGAKNCAFAVETAVWTNILPNPDNVTDTDKLVEIYTNSKASDLLGGATNRQLQTSGAVEKLEV